MDREGGEVGQPFGAVGVGRLFFLWIRGGQGRGKGVCAVSGGGVGRVGGSVVSGGRLLSGRGRRGRRSGRGVPLFFIGGASGEPCRAGCGGAVLCGGRWGGKGFAGSRGVVSEGGGAGQCGSPVFVGRATGIRGGGCEEPGGGGRVELEGGGRGGCGRIGVFGDELLSWRWGGAEFAFGCAVLGVGGGAGKGFV